jgi:hypothetical protein
MHRHLVIAAIAAIAAVLAGALALPAAAQQPLPRPGQQQPPAPQMQQRPQAQPQPQPQQPAQLQMAAPRPYKPVIVSEPKPFADPALAAFRKELAAIAQRKDRNALARMVAQGFFWLKESGDAADKRKSPIDNLAAALKLAARDGSGWQTLGEYAGDETAAPFPERAGVMCAPAGPQFNMQELQALAQQTQTEIGDWGFTSAPNVEVRSAAQQNAPVIERLGVHFVRVIPDTAPNASADWIRIVTPSGKVGFVAGDTINPVGGDQICYARDASGAWKIAGILGGE